MNCLSREELVLQLKPLFKAEGFKKSKSNWYKLTNDLIFVFNVQASLYSEEYYINVGIYIKALGNESTPPEFRCHIRSRINDIKPFEEIFKEAMEWFQIHDSMEKLKELNYNNKLPLTTTIAATDYLSNLL